jgi:TolA-binding protein
MRCLQLIGVIGFVMVSPVWAGGARPASQRAKPVVPALPAVHQRVTRRQGEVKQLERALSIQESDSKRARQRLQQQDQAIAELRKQLQELQSRPADDQH